MTVFREEIYSAGLKGVGIVKDRKFSRAFSSNRRGGGSTTASFLLSVELDRSKNIRTFISASLSKYSRVFDC